MTSAQQLLEEAVRSQATDVLLSPGTASGNIHLRAGFEKIHSLPAASEALEGLCRELLHLAHMGDSLPDHQNQTGTLQYGPARVRVSRIGTPSGSMVRLRLQMEGVLESALQEFRTGAYGGTEVRAFLRQARGLLAVVGLASAGKTSALAHLMADLGSPLLISEAQEIGADSLNPFGRSESELLEWVGSSRPVVLDEMDERLKLGLARRLAEGRLVLAAVTAPTLAAAVQKLVAREVSGGSMLGFLRVSWRGEPRRPAYQWFPLGDGELGRCAICRSPRPERGDCPNCGVPVTPFLDRAVLRRLNSPEGYRALERLEHEWAS